MKVILDLCRCIQAVQDFEPTVITNSDEESNQLLDAMNQMNLTIIKTTKIVNSINQIIEQKHVDTRNC